MSGINAMIDRACGVTPAMRARWQREAAAPKIVLACQRCDAEKVTTRDEVWPKAAAFCLFPCHDCLMRAEKRKLGLAPLEFFDALGVRVPFPT
jgi:hypothetical protein